MEFHPKILYILPHPDDESFGPARAIAAQVRQGHEVFLLTLTRGEATKMRYKFGYSLAEMGEVRYREMLKVKEVLKLAGMTVLDFPDSGLKELDPRAIERAVESEIARVRPAVVVTYPVHGISGFHDHIVGHAVVKRVFVEMRDQGAKYLKRLAFEAMTSIPEDFNWKHLNLSKAEEIDCVYDCTPEDMAVFQRALDCYETYMEVIAESRVREMSNRAEFEIFQEDHKPPLSDLTEGL